MQARAYEGAIESAIALIAPVGLGYWLDKVFETDPIATLVGAVLGFAAMLLRLIRFTRDLDPAGGDAQERPTDQENGQD
ncbi:MAG: AtpZ/AtpI family protein [Myxococcota bacterium]|nr:AtpZ/AtpI family protein [Myxococcota bacterium]